MRRQLALACTVSAALALAACGASSGGQPVTSPGSSSPSASPSSSTPAGPLADQSAEDILAASVAAAQSAGSVRLVIRQTADGKPMVTDSRMAEGVGGDVIVKTGGGTLEVRGLDGQIYVRADRTFWRTTAKAGAKSGLLAGKWFSATADKFPGQAALVSGDLKNFLSDMFELKAGVEKGKTKTVAGHSAIELIDTSDNSSVWISLDGDPYPLLLTAPPGGDFGSATFSAWGEDFAITAPPNPVDISKYL